MDAQNPKKLKYEDGRLDPMYQLHKADDGKPAFELDDGALRLVATIVNGETGYDLPDSTVSLPAMTPGRDYVIHFVDAGALVAIEATDEAMSDPATLGGFHYAPGGNATGRSGGDTTPAINPCSIWDLHFRPACDNPRGMSYIAGAKVPFWCDIYLCGTSPWVRGTSSFDETIADGRDVPMKEDDETPYDNFSYATAVELYAALGKQLLGPEEFFEAAFGVTEATSIGKDPKTTQLDAPRTSKYGIMQATGNMWIWGGDGDPDGHRRASIFGGSWGNGDWAGSRRADVEYWPDYSSEWIGARGRSDHLQPDA